MNCKKILFSVLFLLLFFSCAPNLNYIGNSYKPTKNISLYFDANDVIEPYITIGMLSFGFVPSVINREKDYSIWILNKAKEVGADAVLITNFSSESKNEITEDILTKKVNTETNRYLNISAKFLKYKKD